MTSATIEQRLQDILAAIGQARASLAEGDTVDITGLDGAIAELCDGARQADRGAWPGIAAAMGELKAALDALAADLTRQNSALHLKRATAAYGAEPGREP